MTKSKILLLARSKCRHVTENLKTCLNGYQVSGWFIDSLTNANISICRVAIGKLTLYLIPTYYADITLWHSILFHTSDYYKKQWCQSSSSSLSFSFTVVRDRRSSQLKYTVNPIRLQTQNAAFLALYVKLLYCWVHRFWTIQPFVENRNTARYESSARSDNG